jgi:hypothetical protein
MKHRPHTLAILPLLLCAAVTSQAQVVFKPAAERVEVEIDGRHFTTFHFGAEHAKPFLHPLNTTTGLAVTRGVPPDKGAGESVDHPHHRGLWFAHDSLGGYKFWNEPKPERAGDAAYLARFGRMKAKGAPTFKGGKSSGTLAAEFDLTAPEKGGFGTLSEQFTFRRSGANHVVDVTVTILADRGAAIRMGDTEEGTFALRLADEFQQKRGATLLNSDGLKGTENIWGKRARWVDYSTTLKGERVGVAVFDHPQNPKHPTYWHARGYGLLAANPFGEHDFHKDPARDGGVTIPPGGKLTFRYRVVIHPGDAEAAAVEKLAAAFAGEK